MPDLIVQQDAGAVNPTPSGGYTITFPAPATAGNTLLVAYRAYAAAPPVPAGWVVDAQDTVSPGPLILYRREATGGETGLTLAVDTGSAAAHVFAEVSGLTTTPLDVAASNGSGSDGITSWTTPSVTPKAGVERFLLAAWGGRQTNPITASGYTNGFTEIAQASSSGSGEDVLVAAASLAELYTIGSYSSTATFSAGTSPAGITAAYVVAPAPLLPPSSAAARPPTYQVMVADTRTGRILDELPALPRWSTGLNTAGQASVDIPLTDASLSERSIRQITLPGRATLVVVYGSEPVWAGPIWSHRYSAARGVLSLSAAGLWSLLDSRYVLPVLGSNVPITDPSADTVLTNLTLGSIARRIVNQALGHTGGNLPLVLPAEVAGTNERTYRGYELPQLGEALRQLTAVQNGPDLDFRPRWSATPGYIEWVMRIGSPLLGQVGSPHVWDYPGGGVVDLEVEESGRPLARVYAVGSGMERAMLTSRSEDLTLVNAGWPLLEGEVSRKTVEVQSTLDGWASSTLAALDRQVTAWTATVRADADPILGTYSLGDDAVLSTTGDPYLPDGAHPVRIVGIASGPDAETTVTLTMAPTEAQV